MKRLATLALLLVGAAADARQTTPAPFVAGKPLGTVVDGATVPLSRNVRVYGGMVNAESCSFDPSRNLIVVPSRGAAQDEVPNDGFVALLNPDGTLHTARWIGTTRDGLTLNHPFGSEIAGGTLYLADYDGGTADSAPRNAVIRLFDLASGRPTGSISVPGSAGLNDIAVAADGTVYATQTGNAEGTIPMRLYRIPRSGAPVLLVEGAPLARPNGVALDPKGNVVVANMNDTAVLTFSPAGKLIKTERAAQAGSDGLVILSDGTKYVSSVLYGGISRIRPGRPPELIATGIPAAASMCYDPRARRLVVPMNANNAVAFVGL